MRTLSREYDLPDGVVDGEWVAHAVLAEFKHDQAFRSFLARTQHDPTRAPSLIPADECARRADLLARARAGEAAAELELWLKYRVRILATPQVMAHERDRVKPGAQATGGVGAADAPTSTPNDLANPVAPGVGRSPGIERRCACGAPLGRKAAKGQCRRCYNRDVRRRLRGSPPLYVGPCIACGMRPGRGRSKRCLRCYRLAFYGQRRRERAWRDMTGSERSITQVRLELLGLTGTPAQHDALDVVQRLLRDIDDGRALLERNPWATRRQRTEERA